jgi:hypothetical protein
LMVIIFNFKDYSLELSNDNIFIMEALFVLEI